MRQHSSSCHVHMPPSQLWQHLADYDNIMKLAAPGGSAILLKGEHGTPGAEYECRFEWEGLSSVASVQLIGAQRSSLLEWKSIADKATGNLRYWLAPEGDGTSVTVDFALTMGRGLKTLEPFAWALWTRMHESAMRRLQKLTSEGLDLRVVQ